MLGPLSMTVEELVNTGLLCALTLGDTARRLKRLGSKSSSRRRLRRNSPMVDVPGGWGVAERERERFLESAVDPMVVDGVITMETSSSPPDDVF